MVYDLELIKDYYEDVKEFKYAEFKRIIRDIFKGELNIKNAKSEVWINFLLDSHAWDEIEIYIINMGLNK